MPKVKIPRKSTHQDMTAMTDIAFLLLNFFILTSNFTKKEPIQVSTPSSVSEIKIPEVNIVTTIVDKDGRVFFDMDGQSYREDLLKQMGERYNIQFTKEELYQFSIMSGFGVPIEVMKQFLALTPEQRDLKENALGIPIDSTNNQFKDWVRLARIVNPKIIISVKADQDADYPVIKRIISTFQDIRENRFNLITSLEENPEK